MRHRVAAGFGRAADSPLSEMRTSHLELHAQRCRSITLVIDDKDSERRAPLMESHLWNRQSTTVLLIGRFRYKSNDVYRRRSWYLLEYNQ
jgi:hypothetical protein